MSVTVNVVGQTAVSISVASQSAASVSVAASTGASVVASGGIGPAGFITVPGTSAQAFGTFQLQAGDGITISTANGQFVISSYAGTAVSSLAPVQSVAGRTGTVVLQASDVTAGTFAIGRIPAIGYTALSGVPTTFAPSSHTHSTTEVVGLTAAFSQPGHTHSTADVTGYQGLPAQAGFLGPLVTDGTNATWTSRYSIVSPVLVQGAGMTLTRDTSAGSITVAFAGSTSGLAVGSLAPLALGVAAAGSSANASREDHVHKLPTVGDITAAAASHTHDAAAVASGVLDIARIPVIGYTAVSGTPSSFAPGAHTHSTTDIVAFTASASAAAPVQSVAGRTGAVVLTKADVGLANADNTADASKPVSTLQAAADAAVQSYAVQRVNHTGTQAASTITGLAAIAVSGSASDLVAGTVPISRLASSGTASSATFLRGDGAWAAAGSTDASTLSSGTVASALLPLATTTTAGTVIVGNGLAVTNSGVLSTAGLLDGGVYSSGGFVPIPTMTSATAPGGIVVATSPVAWRAFGGSLNADTGTLPASISYGFAGGASSTIAGYSVIGGPNVTGLPTAWTFAGSDNGVSWTTLDTRSAAASANMTQQFALSASASYSAYRWTFTAAHSSAAASGFGLQLLAVVTDVSGDFTPIPAMTSSTAPSGVAAGMITDGGSPAWMAFDGDTSTSWQDNFGNTPGTMFLSYAFAGGTPSRISGYRLGNGFSGPASPSAWTFYGSNDGTTWPQLDSRSGVTWAGTGVTQDYTLPAGPAAYSQYKWVFLSVSGANYLLVSTAQVLQ